MKMNVCFEQLLCACAWKSNHSMTSNWSCQGNGEPLKLVHKIKLPTVKNCEHEREIISTEASCTLSSNIRIYCQSLSQNESQFALLK